MVFMKLSRPLVASRAEGITNKHARITGFLAASCALIAIGTLPLDLFNTPQWMPFVDIGLFLMFSAIYLLNLKPAYVLLSAHLLLLFSNVIMFVLVGVMGEKISGQDIYFPLAIFPFLVFNLDRFYSISFYVLLAFVCHLLLQTHGFVFFQQFAIEVSSAFRLQISVISFIGVGLCLYVIRSSNATAETYLQDALDQLNESQKIAGIGTFTFSPDTRRVWWSEEMYTLFGLKRFEFFPTPETIAPYYKEEFREAAMSIGERAIKVGPTQMDAVVIRPDGSEVAVLIRCHGGSGKDGTHVIGTVQNVTDWNKSQEKIKENEIALEMAQRLSKVCSISGDVTKEERICTKEAYKLLDLPLNTPITASLLRSVINPEDAIRYNGKFGKHADFTENLRICTRAGAQKNVRVIVSFVKNPHGETWGNASIQDVTDQMIQRQMMLHAEKLSSLGEVYAGVAHEINQPLLGLELTLSTLAKMEPDQKRVEHLKKSMNMVTRISKIVLGLRTYSRVSSISEPPVPTTVKDILKEAQSVFDFKLESQKVQLTTHISDDASILCLEDQMVQVLVNLVTNSIDAIEHMDDKWIRIETRVVDRRVQICVIDSGRNVSDEVLSKVFNPFFTTKENSRGTGIGLCLSKSIVESFNGKISVSKNENQNTVFCIDFPPAG